jgi:putative ABC transport system permease protein
VSRIIEWFGEIGRRLRILLRRKEFDREMDEEMRLHGEMKEREMVVAGESPEEAHYAARRKVGNILRLREESREAWGWNWLEQFLQDVRYSLRVLRRSPGFATVVILTLALGIGANTVVFSVINAVLLHSLRFRDPARLASVTFDDPGLGLRDVRYSVPEFEDLRTRSGVFEEVSAVLKGGANLTGWQQPQRLELLGVSTTYFSMLGIVPEKGRLFGQQDFALGLADVAIVSDGVWRRLFGADPNIVGKQIELDYDPYTIVGVLPPDFRHPGSTVANDVEVWVTGDFSAPPFPRKERGVRFLSGAIGRLKPGISVEQAKKKLELMSAQVRSDFASDYPPKSKWTVRILPLQESLVGNLRPTLFMLMGTVVLVIVLASVNIANLLLARASTRQREITLRLSLGASRSRIIRQLLTESAFLSMAAGVVGILAAELFLRFLLRFVPVNIPRHNEISMDCLVLGVATLVSVFTGLLFGLAPAVQSSKTELAIELREGARGSGYTRKTHRLRALLIISELAISVVLMIGAGLLMHTFWRLLREDPGFNAAGVVVSSIRLPASNDLRTGYVGLSQQTAFVRECLRRLRTIPGVDSAAMTSDLPGMPVANTSDLAIEGVPFDPTEKLSAEVIRVSPDYFRVMKTPLMRGRFFSENDQAGGLPVAILDEATTQKYWPNRDPIGSRVKLGAMCSFSSSSGCLDMNLPWLTVVGVVKNIKYDGLDRPGVPHIYDSIYEQPGRLLNVALRTSLPAPLLEMQIRNEIRTIDPALPVFNIRSMNDVVETSLAQRRFSAELVGTFASISLLLASIGIYGLLAYLVAQRSQEFAVRVALGAKPGDIFKLVIRQALAQTGIGLAIGLILAFGVGHLLASLLYGILPSDPMTFAAVSSLVSIVALVASHLPARRAMRVDPMVALRYE